MSRPSLPLNALRAFEAAARHQNLTRAALELHVSQAALSHQIRKLEASLGVRLFHRLPRGVALSDEAAAERLSGALNRMGHLIDRLLHLSRAEAGVAGHGPSDLVRVVRMVAADLGTPVLFDDCEMETLSVPVDPDALAHEILDGDGGAGAAADRQRQGAIGEAAVVRCRIDVMRAEGDGPVAGGLGGGRQGGRQAGAGDQGRGEGAHWFGPVVEECRKSCCRRRPAP